MTGNTILHYKILEKLGEGGMGVVYKAKDTKLDREVALKFLSSSQLTTKEEKRRFEQEARAAAKLNHPNIAHVYEINENEGLTFIAMEYVDGETLAERIEKGPLRLKDAIQIAIETAAGLQAAHEKHITHRDIKSANIMLTARGAVKIMDFGLAKLSGRSMVTQAGTTLGTASYMSPEQARGEKVDHRSDIWSLGVVLYEMVSGQTPFRGDYEQAVTYSILNEPPEPLTALRTGVPMSLERVVMKAMAKNPDERYQHVDEIPVDLETALKEAESGAQSQIGVAPAKSHHAAAPSRKWVIILTAATVALVAISFVLGRYFSHQDPRKTTHFRLGLTELTDLLAGTNKYDAEILALAPDDGVLAYLGEKDGFPGIFIHDFAEPGEPRRLQGTEYAKRLAFGPDGGNLTFSGAGGLYRISISGGAPVKLTGGVPDAVGIDWGQDGFVYYAPDYGTGIWRVPSHGGRPEQVTSPDRSRGEVGHTNPQLLPGDNLLLVGTYGRGFEIQIIDVGSGERTPLSEGGYCARYVEPGFIVYVQGKSLMAMPFDIRKRSGGRPFVAIESLTAHTVTFRAQYNVSRSGSIAYLAGSQRWDSGLVVRNFDGSSRPLPISKPGIDRFWLSPSLNYILLAATGLTSDSDLWLYNLANDDLRQLTSDPAWDSFGLWTSAESHIFFASERQGRADIYMLDLGGSDEPRLVYKDDATKYPTSISPDAKFLAFYRATQGNGYDAWVLSLANPSQQLPIATSTYDEQELAFSPKGDWLAYESNESGRKEVYAVSFPEIGVRRKVSDDGGIAPKWSQDGESLYYQTRTQLKRVDVISGSFSSPRVVLDGVVDNWQLTPDGRGIITKGEGEPVELRLTLNWYLELQKTARRNSNHDR